MKGNLPYRLCISAIRKVYWPSYNIIVALIVSCNGGELWSGKFSQWVQAKSVNDQAGEVGKDGRGQSLPGNISQDAHDVR